ncbi:pilus assembly protein PilX [Comamonas sp. GB3 AK4-5]|uniref:pilus assembly PilX family protein n=1 Tax=Comamonas sp. GB3 AK4-5 TaxID=3231487 RepID=UPI00351DD5D7
MLLFLLLTAAISVWGVKQSIFSEQLARNQLDYAAAHEAAETALRDAERDLLNPGMTLLTNASCSRGVLAITPADFSADCGRGLCVLSDAAYAVMDWNKPIGGEVWWPTAKGGKWNNNFAQKPGRVPASAGRCNFSGGVPLGAFTGAAPVKAVARQPEYLVEYFRRKKLRINQQESQTTSGDSNALPWSAMYRITARGFGYSMQTQVVLQTVVFPDAQQPAAGQGMAGSTAPRLQWREIPGLRTYPD